MKKFFLLLLTLTPLLGFSARWYVDQSNNNVIRNGNSWNTAVRHIGYLRNDLEDGDEVWIAQGTYGIQEQFVLLTGTFHHRPLDTHYEEVSIYGGFQGNEVSLNQRNPDLYPTIIQPEGSYVYHWRKSATIDGFKFSGTWDPYDPTFELFDADHFVEHVQITFRNCRFENLDLSTKLFTSPSSDPDDIEFILEDCTFTNVSSPRLNSHLNNTIEMSNCTFQSCNGTDLSENFFWGMHLIQCSITDSYFGQFTSYTLFENCLIANNDFITNSTTVGVFSEFRNCTLAKNTLSAPFGACTFANSIIYDNEPIGPSSTISFSCEVLYSLVDDDLNFVSEIQVVHSDPGFVDPGSGNFQLESCSHAINGGLGTGYQTQDLAGNTRLIGGRVDLGCYEYQGNFPERIYVALNATGNGSGSNWANAMTSLHDALAIACPRTEIWVKQGTYTPAPVLPGNRDATFVVPGGVKLYGGFNGTETNISQRDYENNVTLLSGGIGLFGNQDNSYTVLTLGSGESEVLRVDGFFIGYGNANGSVDDSRGGGINASFPNAEIHNCFIGFNAGIKGAAVYSAGSGDLSFENCTFNANVSTEFGGGIYTGSIVNLRPTLKVNRCTFSNNTAPSGSAFYFDSSVNVYSSVFHDNTCDEGVNGILHFAYSNSSLNNCTVVRNTNNIIYANVPLYVRSTIFQLNGSIFILSPGGTIFWDKCLAEVGIPNITNGNILGSANFIDVDANDFHLQSNSIAINSGSLPAGAPSFDRDGLNRLVGDETDRGAYEYQVGCINSHDFCSNAYDHDIQDDYGMILSLDCTTIYNEPTSQCGEVLASAWFKFELPITGAQVIVNPTVNGSDIQLDFFTGNCDNLEYYACSNNLGPNQGEQLIISGEPTGSTMYVRVSSRNTTQEDASIFIFELPCQLTNTISLGNVGGCYNGPEGEAVFDQELTFTYGSHPVGGYLVVERPLGQDDYFQLTGSPQTVVLTGLPASGNFVSIAAKFVAPNYEACYTPFSEAIPAPCCQPDNDECEFAVSMAINELISGSTRCATYNNWIPTSCILYEGRDLWYTFVAPATAVQIDMNIVELFDGAVNPRMTLFSGSCGSLNEVGCGNDNFEGFDESHVFNGLSPGSTYYLRADMYYTQAARFTLFMTVADVSTCLGDLNGDGLRNVGDLTVILSNFGCTSNCIADLNGDGTTNTGDLTTFLGVFGEVCD